MSDRLPTGVVIGGLRRLVEQAGGSAMILARGDDTAGAILVVAQTPGGSPRCLERGIGPDGRTALIESGPSDGDDPFALTDYWQRRRARDPDLWVIELIVADAERFAAGTIIGA